jgi:ligand-binding sensor protein
MNYHISELIDAQKVKHLMESFYELTEIPSTLVDPQGNILDVNNDEILGAGWKNICLNFHRRHPESLAKCVESDTVLSKQILETKKYSLYRCRNGMVDAAIPIYVSGEHIANLFMGQFFLEPPDQDYFRRQAVEYGYDLEKYLEALRDVPILDMKSVERGLLFLGDLAELIALMGFKEKELLDLKMELEKRVEKRTAELNDAHAEINALRSIVPLCSFCKKVRNDKGYWEKVDVFISKHSHADVSHCVCPECLKKHYPEQYTAIYGDENTK